MYMKLVEEKNEIHVYIMQFRAQLAAFVHELVDFLVFEVQFIVMTGVTT